MQTTLKGRTLTIVVELDESPEPSSSGKTLIAATTSGFVKTGESYKGKPLSVSLNVTIPNK